jgi:hypothetical protein
MLMFKEAEANSIEKRTVQVYFEFYRIGEIDLMNEKYNAEISIESKWVEKDYIQNYNPEHHWNPRLFIENALQEPKEKIKYNIIREGKYLFTCYDHLYTGLILKNS